MYDDTYNKALDGNDAIEVNNWDENIAISRAGKHLSIEERPLLTKTDTLFLYMNNMKQKAYEFEFNPAGLNHPDLEAMLADKYLGTKTPISLTAKTIIPFSVTADAVSSSANRFMVVFAAKAGAPIVAAPVTTSKQMQISPNPVNGKTVTLLLNVGRGTYTIRISNKLGQKIMSKTIFHADGTSTEKIELPQVLANGVYQLNLSGAGISITQQLIKN